MKIKLQEGAIEATQVCSSFVIGSIRFENTVVRFLSSKLSKKPTEAVTIHVNVLFCGTKASINIARNDHSEKTVMYEWAFRCSLGW